MENIASTDKNLSQPVEASKERSSSSQRSEEESKKLTVISEDAESESIGEYKVGGYHPVHIGEIFGNRYLVMQRLGWGHFSTVWLCQDLMTHSFVALKIQKSDKHYLEAAMDEVKLLQAISESWKNLDWVSHAKKYLGEFNDYSACVQLLDSFLYYGPNGKHLVMVFELMGINLLEVIQFYKYKGIPLSMSKSITKQLLIGLDYLHRVCKIIHTDIKPENALLCFRESDFDSILSQKGLTDAVKYAALLQEKATPPRVKWADFGNACWTYHHFTSRIQTREYRAPETILKIEYDTSTDIWSFGCMVFELVTGDYLFKPKAKKSSYTKNDDHLAQVMACLQSIKQIIELIGHGPKSFVLSGKKSKVQQFLIIQKYFNSRGELRRIKGLSFWPLKGVLKGKYKLPMKEAELLSDFILRMVQWEPCSRSSAEELLEHPWLNLESTEEREAEEEDEDSYVTESEGSEVEMSQFMQC
eukprot:TRINITY_DN71496_c0_g1_i1.p1 TRINITY_DN71496_c0_g1~~TRINITY_DN71496_c0_g1_i1.p1  ORF type:complete len:505 (-),score=21.58 TRINITY_DN71496_c0_g1_i1:93-1508(-)